jgi:hypothetical protein
VPSHRVRDYDRLAQRILGTFTGGRRKGREMRPTIRRLLAAALTAGAFAATPAAVADTSITLDGATSFVIVKKDFTSLCPSGVADECGTMQLIGLGVADWTYAFGPTFEPNGDCFDVDGTFTTTLRSDGSTISGALTGAFCPVPSKTGHDHSFIHAYGNPFAEHDTIEFTDGTGQFDGLSGTANFNTFVAGARFRGTLTGTLTD